MSHVKPTRGLQLFLHTATKQGISPPKANKTVTALSPHKTLKHKEQHRYRNISPPSYTVAHNSPKKCKRGQHMPVGQEKRKKKERLTEIKGEKMSHGSIYIALQRSHIT